LDGCLGCDLTSGKLDLPGGRIYATSNWLVEHCIGPLGVGTLIVKPFRHCVHFWELTQKEVEELGPLLHKVAATIEAILKPDQVYICLWSHAGWTAGHLHFLLQPSWDHWSHEHSHPGPFLQVDLFKAGIQPDREKVEAFCTRAREVMLTL
jgi:diadenosine tetraphosphate (Ap4A) HIT family hydrolase